VEIADLRASFHRAGLDLADLAADPVTQWHRWHDVAVAAGCTEPDAAALATVDGAGRPDVRYVLVRRADAAGFWFYTNAESPKAAQLTGQGAGALAFGWLELHRQVRVRGPVQVAPRHEVEAYFSQRPRDSQIAAWASRQSSVLAERADLDAAVAATEARFAGADVPTPPWAGAFRIAPDEVEFWQGRPARLHDRLRYRRDASGWLVERLAP
jgi:pyridoxamine 5'-phosphate oxidase